MFDGTLPKGVREYLGLQITNPHSRHDVMTWLRYQNGKIVEKRAKYNEYAIYKQHGVPEILALDKKICLPIK